MYVKNSTHQHRYFAKGLPSFHGGTLNARDNDIVFLVERYLSNVHTKHPFVNVDILRREARKAKEYGADSSAWGCTVVRILRSINT